MKFENVLTVLTQASQDISNAKASIENCETFHAIYDAAIDCHPVFIKHCNNTQEVRELMQEAIAYAVGKMIHKGADKIVLIKEEKEYPFMVFSVTNGKLSYVCFDPSTQNTIVLTPKDVEAVILHGTKINITA